MPKSINDWHGPACGGQEFEIPSPTRFRESDAVFVRRGGPSLERPIEISDPYPN